MDPYPAYQIREGVIDAETSTAIFQNVDIITFVYSAREIVNIPHMKVQ